MNRLQLSDRASIAEVIGAAAVGISLGVLHENFVTWVDESAVERDPAAGAVISITKRKI